MKIELNVSNVALTVNNGDTTLGGISIDNYKVKVDVAAVMNMLDSLDKQKVEQFIANCAMVSNPFEG